MTHAKGINVKALFFTLLLLGIPISPSIAEEQAYITDQLEVTLRTGQSAQHKIKRMLKSGKPVFILEENDTTGYTKIRLNNGSEGWTLTRHLLNKPIARQRLKTALEALATLKAQNEAILTEASQLKENQGNVLTENQSLGNTAEKLREELNNLKTTAANAIQVSQEKELLQERVVNLERKIQAINRNNQMLKDSSSQDWFLIGGGVLFLGVLLGVILPKIGWRKKSNWDSF